MKFQVFLLDPYNLSEKEVLESARYAAVEDCLNRVESAAHRVSERND